MWAITRIALFLALSFKVTAVVTAEHKDTCIIGAGPAGIGAALALTDKGLGTSFVLLEREKAVGGQTLPAYTDPATGACRCSAIFLLRLIIANAGFRVHMGAIGAVLTLPSALLCSTDSRRGRSIISPHARTYTKSDQKSSSI
jgi:hypothetical protein